MRIQLFAEDLMLFQGLEPDSQDMIAGEQLKAALEKHREFLLEKVSLRDAAGEKYQGTVTGVKPFEIPESGLAVADLMLHTATYEIEYPFAQPPEFLTIQQDISDANFIFPSEMQLSVHQTGTDLTYTDSLGAGAPVSLRFDWSAQPPDASASDEEAEKEWEQWFEKQREATLGITSYSSIYSFIYIETAEVRHEVLIPLASLKAILPLQHQDPSFLAPEEQDAARQLIRDWMKDFNPATINGRPVPTEFTRIDFYGLDLKDFATQAAARKVSMASGRVGIMLTWRPVEDAVRSTTLTWNLFNGPVKKVESVVFCPGSEVQRFEFSRYKETKDNVLQWICPAELLPRPVTEVLVNRVPPPTMTIPAGTIALSGAGALMAFMRSIPLRWRRVIVCLLFFAGVALSGVTRISFPHPWKSPPELSDSTARNVFTQLHSGIYRAPEFGTETQIYNVLSKTTSGSLLQDIYLQLRQSLEMREQGGAIARVRSVEHHDFQQLARTNENPPWPGFRVRSSWTVSGTVEHWGHVHERQNRFAAVFTIQPENQQPENPQQPEELQHKVSTRQPRSQVWRITGMEIEDQQQVLQKTSLRKF